MNSDLRELYSELILEHNAQPKNSGALDNPTHVGKGTNPACGDSVEVYLNVLEDRVEDISFCGMGCAICIASCSLMTQCVKGKSIQAAKKTSQAFFSELSGTDTEKNTDGGEQLDPDSREALLPLLGIRRLPSRTRCATLSWNALSKALASDSIDPADKTAETANIKTKVPE